MNVSFSNLTRSLFKPSSGFRRRPIGWAVLPVCALLVSLALAPIASAKAPDGVYKFTGGLEQIEFGGELFPLKLSRLKEIGSVKNGSITVKNGKLMLSRDAARNIIKDYLGINPDIAIKGPSSITFRESGKSFIGTSPNPVVVNFTGNLEGKKVVGVIRSSFTSKVTGRKLVINVKVDGTMGFEGSTDKLKVDGYATITSRLSL